MPETNLSSVTLLLTKLCTSLVGHHSRKDENSSPPISTSRNISERETNGLQYLGGYVLRNVHFEMKKSKEGFKSSLAALSVFKNENKPTDHKLVSALDRNGLWYISEEFQNILLLAEKTFCFEVRNRKSLRLINQDLICSKIVENTAVYNIFQNSLDNADVVITDGESKDLLYALLKLFVRVRSFNFAKDIVQATKLKNIAERNSKKALRQNLKAAEDLDNIGV